MRVAFTLFGGENWTGGMNYLRNLLSAVAEVPALGVEPVLFIAPDTAQSGVEMLSPYLAQPPVVVQGWNRKMGSRLVRLSGSAFLQRDFISERAFRDENIDVVFQHAAWYGLNFPLPTLAWIADFQHKHLPQMFSRTNNLKRDLGYMALSRCATRLMVSSEDARIDCERFFPQSIGRIEVLPFCVQNGESVLAVEPSDVVNHHDLPQRFFYLPNQLWRHKNHLGLIEALRILKDRNSDVVVVASGNPKDDRNPDHPALVQELVKHYGLGEYFRFLGLIPYEHIMPLMRASLAVINPSLFEGWSTTVEEAKSVGVPLLLSDLGVHQEQAADVARFFDPHDPEAIANCLELAWKELDMFDRSEREANAVAFYRQKRVAFAENFFAILNATLHKK